MRQPCNFPEILYKPIPNLIFYFRDLRNAGCWVATARYSPYLPKDPTSVSEGLNLKHVKDPLYFEVSSSPASSPSTLSCHCHLTNPDYVREGLHHSRKRRLFCQLGGHSCRRQLHEGRVAPSVAETWVEAVKARVCTDRRPAFNQQQRSFLRGVCGSVYPTIDPTLPLVGKPYNRPYIAFLERLTLFRGYFCKKILYHGPLNYLYRALM